MKIDSQSGAITLPGGFVLDSASKMEAFRHSNLYDADNVYNPNTPWHYHRFRDGAYENHPLGFVACFYQSPHSRESVLTTCSFAASRASASAKDVAREWSLEEDARDLELNLRLLEELLGKPHDRQKNRSSWDNSPIFQSDWFYKFKWGHVWCGSEDIKTRSYFKSPMRCHVERSRDIFFCCKTRFLTPKGHPRSFFASVEMTQFRTFEIASNLIDTSINLRYLVNAQGAHDDYERHRKPRKPRAPVDQTSCIIRFFTPCE